MNSKESNSTRDANRSNFWPNFLLAFFVGAVPLGLKLALNSVLGQSSEAPTATQLTPWVLTDEDDCVGSLLELRATGQTSGWVAKTRFTDGTLKIKISSAIASDTFSVNWTKYSYPNIDCTGTVAGSGTQTGVGSSGGAVFNLGVGSPGSPDSVKLEAAATSDLGGIFVSWTSSDTFTTDISNPRIICVPGNFNGNREYTANYRACTPPSITGQSTAQTVCSGATATFSLTAAGDGLTYRWRKGGVNLNNAPTGNGSTYSGVTSPALTITSTQTGDATTALAGFDCLVSGTCTPSKASTRVALTVTTSVGGTAAASPSEVCSGSTSSIALSGNVGAIQKWQKSTDSGATWTDIVSTANPLTTSALTQTTQFRAVVKSGVCAEANSSAATVTVDPTSVGGTAAAAPRGVWSGSMSPV